MIDLVRSVLVAVLQYLRWSQLLPMILAWVFALLGLGMFILLAFEQQAIAGSVFLVELLRGLPGTGWLAAELGAAAEATPSGGVRITSERLTPVVMRFWAWASLILWLLSLVRARVLGLAPRAAVPLRLQLIRTALAVLLFFLALGVCLLWSPRVGPQDRLPLLAGSATGAGLLFVVTGYSVVVAWLIDGCLRKLEPSGA